MKPLFAKFLIVLFLLFTGSASSQTTHKTEAITGLPGTSINSLYVDNQGIIWIGTNNGLCRYDGVNKQIFLPDLSDSSSIAGNHIQTIFESSDNNLWFGTNNGLSRLNKNGRGFTNFLSLNQYPTLKNISIHAISEVNKHTIWFGTDQHGLFSFDTKNLKIEKVLDHQNKQVNIEGVKQIITDSIGNIWISGENEIYKFDLKTSVLSKLFLTDRMRDDRIAGIEFQNGELWILLSSGKICVININTDQIRSFGIPDRDNTTLYTSLHIDNNLLMAGTENSGLVVFQISQSHQIKLTDRVGSKCIQDKITSVCSATGAIIIGTKNSGAFISNVENPLLYKPFFKGNSNFLELPLNSLCVLNRDTLLAGTNEGLILYNLVTKEIEHKEIIHSKSRKKIESTITDLEISNKAVWIATDGDGFGIVDIKSGIYMPYQKLNLSEENPDKYINCLHVKDTNSVFYGSYRYDLSKGVNLFDTDNRNVNSTLELGNYNEFISCIAENDENEIFVGTQGFGLNKIIFNPVDPIDISFKQYEINFNGKAYKHYNVNCITKDQSGDFWIGTDMLGIISIAPIEGSRTRIPKLYNIINILEDNFNRIWLTSPNQIYLYEKESETLNDLSYLNSNQALHFKANTIVKSEDGMLYIGTGSGLVAIDPENLSGELSTNQISCSFISVFSNDRTEILYPDPKELIFLDWPTEQINFNVFNTSLRNKLEPGYHYRLKGFDKQWKSGKVKQVSYIDLKPGKYEFELKNPFNQIKSDYSVSFFIAGPFYYTSWFKILMIGIIIILLLLYTYINREKEKYLKGKELTEFESLLSAEKNQFYTLINSLPDAIFIKDKNGKYLIANKQFALENDKGSVNDILGKFDHEIYSKEISLLHKEDEEKILNKGIPALTKDELTFDAKGNKKYISVTRVPLKNNKGEVVGLIGIGRNITKLKSAEQKLIEQSNNLKEINTLLEERQEEIECQKEELTHQKELYLKERKQLRTLIDSMPDVIYIKDTEARFITANKALIEVMKTGSLDNLIHKTDYDFYPKEIADQFFNDDMQVLKSGEPLINHEEIGFDDKGIKRIMSTTKVPFKDHEGKVLGLIGIGRDITKQKINEKKLIEQAESLQEINVLLEERQEEIVQQSEELAEQRNRLEEEKTQLQSLIDNLPDVIYFKDKNAKFITANERLIKVMKAGTLENLVGKSDFNFYEEELATQFFEDDMQVIKTGNPIFNKVERGYDPEGNERIISTSKIPMKTPSGEIFGMIGIGRDITDIQKARDEIELQANNLMEINVLLEERQEEILHVNEKLNQQKNIIDEEKNQLRTLIDNMPDMIYIKDNQARFITANKTLLEVLKVDKPSEIIGKSDHDFYNRDLADLFFEDDMNIIKSGKPLINKEELGIDNKGRDIYVSTTKVPVRNQDGEIVGLVGIGRNITTQKQYEEKLIDQTESLQEINVQLEERQEEIYQQSEELKAQSENLQHANQQLEKLNKTKNKFFNILAHDLKNPFHAILGFSEMIISNFYELQDERKIELLSLIKSSSENAYSLLENLLHWSRSQTERINYEPIDADMNALIKNNIEFHNLSAENKHITFNLDLEENAIGFVDENMMNTVIRNLISNALKFSDLNSTIDIRTKILKNSIQIQISDHGIGIPKQNLSRLFQINEYFTTKGTAGESGTGLGLIISNEFVLKNKGTIHVESIENEGTTFTIHVPKA